MRSVNLPENSFSAKLILFQTQVKKNEKFEVIVEVIGAIRNLNEGRSLFLSNKFKEVKDPITLLQLLFTIFKEELNSVEVLDLSEIELTALPTEIGNLTNLKHINLYNNKLTTLPTEIGKLTNLTFLDLSRNELTTLPTEIVNLTNLTSLRLDTNKLTTLPSGVRNLIKLEVINFMNNQLTTLPSLQNLPRNVTIYANNNPLTRETMNMLRQSFDNVQYDMTAHTKVFNYQEFIKDLKLINEEEVKVLKIIKDDRKVNGKSLEDFFSKLRYTSFYEANPVLCTEVIKHILKQLTSEDEEISNLTKFAIKEASGNCATPITNCLMTYQVQYLQSIGKEIPDSLFLRVGLTDFVIKQQKSLNIGSSGDPSELFEALVNFYCLPKADEYIRNKFPIFGVDQTLTSPSASVYEDFGFNLVKPKIAKELAKRLCKIDE